ncbi:hypothetical protein GCM10010211_79750 [Streptomyces albospinus]|uniref:Uncharacterized protein n=1 Tax=Streptomyces albospinus TaxID=285515 RepID=A0ABQ2VNM6_9ACTN|nr:hypothetical protein GCM10010211_79750 [Streptomyces albospinus]
MSGAADGEVAGETSEETGSACSAPPVWQAASGSTAAAASSTAASVRRRRGAAVFGDGMYTILDQVVAVPLMDG